VTELLSGSDDELEAAIQQAQAEAEACAAELERWNQRQDELRQTRDRARHRIAELRPKRMELLAEALLRGNKRAQDRLSQLTRDLRELDSVVDDYEQVMMMAAGEGAKLLARVAQHSAPVRHLQAKLKARELVRQARAADEAAVAFLRELAAVRQSVEELVPLVPESARHYLDQFRAGDLPTRLSLAYHCRAMGQPAMPAVSELGPEPVAGGPRQS
jgi:chromosome segregation ATPase